MSDSQKSETGQIGSLQVTASSVLAAPGLAASDQVGVGELVDEVTARRAGLDAQLLFQRADLRGRGPVVRGAAAGDTAEELGIEPSPPSGDLVDQLANPDLIGCGKTWCSKH